jgi:hypothetical protein
MKLSQDTVAILKNFSTINHTIFIKAGNVVKTKSGAADVFGTAEIAETFPVDFAIYELSRFLNAMSLFTDPDLEFSEDSAVTITDGKNSIRYVFADPSLISGANYDKEIKLPPVIASFELKQEQLAKMQKAAAVLGNPTVTIFAKNGSLVVSTHDKKNSSSDKFSLNIGTTDAPDFKVDLKLETLRMINGDYTVDVTEKVVCKFTHTTSNLSYLVAGEVTL